MDMVSADIKCEENESRLAIEVRCSCIIEFMPTFSPFQISLSFGRATRRVKIVVMKQMTRTCIIKGLSGRTVGSLDMRTAANPMLPTNRDESKAPPTRSASLKKAGNVFDLFASTSAQRVVTITKNAVAWKKVCSVSPPHSYFPVKQTTIRRMRKPNAAQGATNNHTARTNRIVVIHVKCPNWIKKD